LSEGHKLRVFEKRTLREKITGGWRKIHTEELHNLYSKPNIKDIKSRSMR
jgi:hypothetical protein